MTDQNTLQTPRIFVVGTNRIVEDGSTTGLNNEAVRKLLQPNYPEVAHATIRERTTEDGQRIVEFMPAPGRKG